MPRDVASAVKVGATVLIGILVCSPVAIFLIGERQFLFSRKNSYFVEFENVSNLTVGNPVQLNGVTVGKVEDIVLPEATDATVQVWITRRPPLRSSASVRTRRRASRLSASSATSTSRSTRDRPGVPAIEAGGQIAGRAGHRDRRAAVVRRRRGRQPGGGGQLALQHPVAHGARRGTAGSAGGRPRRRQDHERHGHRHPHRPARRAGRRQGGQGLARAPALRRQPGQRPRGRGVPARAARLEAQRGRRPAAGAGLRPSAQGSVRHCAREPGDHQRRARDHGRRPQRRRRSAAAVDEGRGARRRARDRAARPAQAAQRGDREAQPRRRHRGQAAQRPRGLRRDQRYPGRDQRVAHAPLVDPKPAEGGHSRALRRRPER